MTEAVLRQQEPEMLLRSFGDGELPEQPLVFLHGWGCDSRVWEPLAALLQQKVLLVDLPGLANRYPAAELDLITLLSLLAAQLPHRSHLIGWSLGGMIATAFAAQHPSRVISLVCIGTNLRFQSNPDWPCGMDQAMFLSFKKNFDRNPQLTLQRFRTLQARGDNRERQVIRTLTALADTPAGGSTALDLLGTLDNRAAAEQLPMPCLYLFGEMDQLVPVACAQALRAHPQIQTEVLPGQAHAPHLSDPASLAQRLADFYRDQQHRLNKQHIAVSFGRSAASYDSAAHLQRAVGEHLLHRLAEEPKCILDLGCGTGHFSNILQSRFAASAVLGIDLAEGMVRFARQSRSTCIHWLCGDAEQLPLEDAVVDLVFSNLTIQWCGQLTQLAQQIHRVLKPGGIALLSTLGPATLRELRAAWEQVDGFVHVNRFIPAQQLKEQLQLAGFTQVTFSTEIRKVYYPDIFGLSRELKALGAHNVNAGRPTGMTGRKRLQQFASAYETFREAGQLPATWEVIYCEAHR